MSNKLKTLSRDQLEELIARKISDYIGFECECEVTDLSTPRFSTENEEDTHNENDISFYVRLRYTEE